MPFKLFRVLLDMSPTGVIHSYGYPLISEVKWRVWFANPSYRKLWKISRRDRSSKIERCDVKPVYIWKLPRLEWLWMQYHLRPLRCKISSVFIDQKTDFDPYRAIVCRLNDIQSFWSSTSRNDATGSWLNRLSDSFRRCGNCSILQTLSDDSSSPELCRVPRDLYLDCSSLHGCLPKIYQDPSNSVFHTFHFQFS
jgi:hypothetical protein